MKAVIFTYTNNLLEHRRGKNNPLLIGIERRERVFRPKEKWAKRIHKQLRERCK